MRAPTYADDRIIRLLVPANPKLRGSMARARFELYVDGMSVGQALRRGVTRRDLGWDSARGHIRIEQPR